MRWQGRRESDNVEDRRGDSGSPGRRRRRFRLPSGKGGIVLLIIAGGGLLRRGFDRHADRGAVSQQQTTTQRSISPQEEKPRSSLR
jgi:predicted metalloprotease